MMNKGSSITIPRTDRFMERFETRMKFLLGNDVHIGQDYNGWETVQGESYDGACRPFLYESGHLYVLEMDAGGVVVLQGDLADYQDRLMADGRHARYSIAELRNKVTTYMEKNGITEYSSEVGRHALWVKMVPQSMIMERVKVYEMTKNL